jgi:hypothetical protein
MQDEIDRTAARLRAAVKPLAALAKQYNDDN